MLANRGDGLGPNEGQPSKSSILRRHRTLTTRILALAMTAGVLLLTAGCNSGGSAPASSHDGQSQARAAGTAQRSTSSVTTTLSLSSTTVKAGARLHGEVTVQNDSGHAIKVPGCGIFQILLMSRTYQPSPRWLTCLASLTIPTGQSSYGVTILTTTLSCGGQAESNQTLSACPGPALPAGAYKATTFVYSNAVPPPAPVGVRITK